MLCCYEARKRVGVTGKVIGLCYSPEEKERLDKLGFCHEVVCMDARQPIPVLEKITELTNGEMCDITINNVNVPDTEMTSILCTKNTGIVYFFSMATSFTKAALAPKRRQRRDDDYRKRLYEGTCRDHASGVPRMRTSQKNIHRAVRLTDTNDTCRLSSSSPPGAN